MLDLTSHVISGRSILCSIIPDQLETMLVKCQTVADSPLLQSPPDIAFIATSRSAKPCEDFVVD